MDPDYFSSSTVMEDSQGRNRVWVSPSQPGMPLYAQVSIISQCANSYHLKRDPSFFKYRPPYLAVELVVSGNAHLVASGHHFEIGPGDMYLVSPFKNMEVSTGPAGYLHKRCVEMSGDSLESIMKSLGLHNCYRIVPSSPAAIAELYKKINRTQGERRPGYLKNLCVLAYELLIETARAHVYRDYPESVTDVIDFMHLHLDKVVSGGELAQVAGKSIPRLHQLFLEYAGMSPKRYFVHLKMNHAKELLRDSLLSVKQVADRLGYKDQCHFSKAFHAHTGVWPKDFRMRFAQSRA